MRETIYAVVAACLAMLATSGIVAFATAAPPEPTELAVDPVEQELVAQMDVVLAKQLGQIKQHVAPGAGR